MRDGSAPPGDLHGLAAGIIMVAGAGNSAVNGGTFVPAAFPEVISVSALADFDAVRGVASPAAAVLPIRLVRRAMTRSPSSATTAPRSTSSPPASASSRRPRTAATPPRAGRAWPPRTSAGWSRLWRPSTRASPRPQPGRSCSSRASAPNGSLAGVDGACSGQGTWADDPDGTPEPMANALGAALAAGGSPPVPPRRRRRP